MSKILLATFGSLGDLHPYIAVARELAARGHEAVLATSPDYRAAVEVAGIGFAPVRPSIDSFGDREAVTRRLLHPLWGTQRLLRDCVMPYLEDSLADLTAAASGVDLFVSHPLTFTIPLVARAHGRPWVSTVLAPLSLLSKQAPPRIPGFNLLQISQRLGPGGYELAWRGMRRVLRTCERPLQVLRNNHGLADTGQVMMMEGQYSPHGTLALFDSPLAVAQPDWPVPLRVCGSALYDGEAPEAHTLDDLQRFLGDGDPPLVFALGSSAVWIAEDYWQHAIAAAQSLGRRAILLTGKTVAPGLPPGVRAYPYLPYSYVFPRAAAIVHQAGIGTLSQALRSGRPQLITPVAFDQPDNADRAAWLGVARVLPFRKVTSRRLAEQLKALLADEDAAAAARRVAADLRETNGAAAAADWLTGKVHLAARQAYPRS